jgi:hypothetical protein
MLGDTTRGDATRDDASIVRIRTARDAGRHGTPDVRVTRTLARAPRVRRVSSGKIPARGAENFSLVAAGAEVG